MKKMFFLTLFIIIVIASFFLIFSSNMDILNQAFLSRFEIKTDLNAVSQEEFIIPNEFDEVYQNYNLIQLESGFDLTDYRGEKAVRYSYKMLNFPKKELENVYATVICVKNRQIGGDICCTDIDGFILPLNFLQTYNSN